MLLLLSGLRLSDMWVRRTCRLLRIIFRRRLGMLRIGLRILLRSRRVSCSMKRVIEAG